MHRTIYLLVLLFVAAFAAPTPPSEERPAPSNVSVAAPTPFFEDEAHIPLDPPKQIVPLKPPIRKPSISTGEPKQITPLLPARTIGHPFGSTPLETSWAPPPPHPSSSSGSPTRLAQTIKGHPFYRPPSNISPGPPRPSTPSSRNPARPASPNRHPTYPGRPQVFTGTGPKNGKKGK